MFIVFLLLPNKFPNEDKLFCIIRAGAQYVQYLKQKSVFFMAIIVLFKAIIKLRKTDWIQCANNKTAENFWTKVCSDWCHWN